MRRLDCLCRSLVVNKISVGREGRATITGFAIGNQFHRAVGCDLPQPEAQLAIPLHFIHDVFPIGRNAGGAVRLPIVRQSLDRHLLRHGARWPWLRSRVQSQAKAATTITAITAAMATPVLWRLASPRRIEPLEGVLGRAADTGAEEAAAVCVLTIQWSRSCRNCNRDAGASGRLSAPPPSGSANRDPSPVPSRWSRPAWAAARGLPPTAAEAHAPGFWRRLLPMCSPWKGIWPVAIWYMTEPKENRSLRASSSSPRACSGDM